MKGNFLTEDSYLGDIRNPLTLNRYSYCIGNPLFYVDPSGNAITDYKATDNVKNQIRLDLLYDMPAGGIEEYELYRQYNERISFYESLNWNGHWDYPWYASEEQRISYIVNYDFNSKSGKAYVETCMQRAKIMEKAKRCEEAISKIDGYLEGNVGEEEARKYIEELAKEGAFYGGKSIKSVKSYKSDDKDKDYDQFDTLIIGWVAYYNKKNPDYSINPEWVKAMIYEESRYSYVYSKSPNANASKDIMQTLDPRNPTIFGYVNVDIDKTYVAGPGYKDENDRKKMVTVAKIRELNDKGPILQENVGGDIIPIAQTLFSKEGDKYYYKYSNATPFMSLGIGINTLQEKYKLLGTSSTPDDIMAAYNVGNDYYVEKINYLLDLEVHSGWENEYDEKFKK